ncbi:MAG: ROK family protein [Alphaproteobacteria bacterium]|nr:ROK family protein [Alphaproteobacteria bacterium SS10]
MIRIGIDLGGTKIEAVALDNTGNELLRQRVATPKDDYEGTIAAIDNLIKAVERQVGDTSTVGIGMPGAISPASGLVKNANSTWLIGKPFDKDVAAALGRPVRAQNDANCLAVSEATDGAAAGAEVVFAVIIGTGTGAGIAINGRAVTGRHAIAGEFGHNPLPWPSAEELPGPKCYCGKYGCIETWVSGPGFSRDHAKHTGQELDGPAIHNLVRTGDPQAIASIERYEDRLARSLSHVINILDPNVIVLGGGMSNFDRLYDNLPGLLNKYCFSDGVDVPIRPAVHGDSSGVRGAANLWTAEEAAAAAA